MAVTFDAVGPAGGGGTAFTASPGTWTHVNGGNGIFVGVTWFTGGSNTTTGVTYGGVTIPLLASIPSDNSNVGGIALYGLVGATVPSGSNTVSVTFSDGGSNHNAGSISVSGATTLGTAVTAFASATSVSGSFSATTSGNLIVSFICNGNGSTINATAPNVQRLEKLTSPNSGSDNIAGGTDPSAGGSQTVTWVLATGTDFWGFAGIEVQADGSPGIPAAEVRPGKSRTMHHHGTRRQQIQMTFGISGVTTQLPLAVQVALDPGDQVQVGANMTASPMSAFGTVIRSVGRSISSPLSMLGAVLNSVGRSISTSALTVYGGLQTTTGRLLTALMVVVATLGTQKVKLLAVVAQMVANPAVTRSIGRLLTSITTLTSAVQRALTRILSAISVTYATLTRVRPLALAAQVVTYAAQKVSAGRLLAGTVAATARQGITAGRLLSAPVAVTASLTRQVSRLITAIAVITSTTAFTKVKLLAISAAVAVSASITRNTGRLVSGTVTVTESQSVRIGRLITATAVIAASTARSIGKIMSALATAFSSVSLIKVKLLTLSAIMTATAAAKMSTGRILAAVAVANAAVSVRVGKIMTATTVVFSSVTRSCGRALKALTTVTGTISALRVHLLALAAQVALRGAQAARTGRLVTAQVIATATAGRGIPAAIRALFAVTAKSVTGRAVVLKAVITSSGSVLATVMRPVGLIIFKLGVPAFRWVAGNIKKQWRVP